MVSQNHNEQNYGNAVYETIPGDGVPFQWNFLEKFITEIHNYNTMTIVSTIESGARYSGQLQKVKANKNAKSFV